MHRLCHVFDDRGSLDLVFYHKFLGNVSVLYFTNLCSKKTYLPTLAGYPTCSLLPICGGLDGVFLQPLTVGTYVHTKSGEFHGGFARPEEICGLEVR